MSNEVFRGGQAMAEIMMERAVHGAAGGVEIAFNSQMARLPGPDGKFWLPCDLKCNRLVLVDADVVSTVCVPCWNSGGVCVRCGYPLVNPPGAHLGACLCSR